MQTLFLLDVPILQDVNVPLHAARQIQEWFHKTPGPPDPRTIKPFYEPAFPLNTVPKLCDCSTKRTQAALRPNFVSILHVCSINISLEVSVPFVRPLHVHLSLRSAGVLNTSESM